jgi:hypothetical protein
MIEFKIEKKDITKIVDSFIKKYGIEESMAEAIYENIKNTSPLEEDEDDEKFFKEYEEEYQIRKNNKINNDEEEEDNSIDNIIEGRPRTLTITKQNEKMIIESRLIFNEPPKIITTFDSFHYVKEVLQEMEMLDDFRIIVDEQQSIIKDSAFKGNTIKNFLKELNGLNKVIYLMVQLLIQILI